MQGSTDEQGRGAGAHDATSIAAAASPLGECLAGIVASFVTLAYCLSFSALIFSGDLRAGLAMGLWGFAIGSGMVTILSSLATTLPPLLAGPRNPAVAVMSVLAGTIAVAAARHGLGHEEAARHVLVGLSVASVLTGALIWLLGRFGLGQVVRFVPYPVVAGFLAASGALLLAGGVRVAAGNSPSEISLASLATGATLRLLLAAGFLALVLRLRRTAMGARALPAVIILAALALDAVLMLAGIGHGSGWYLEAETGALAWSPLANLGAIDWRVLAPAAVEILSIAGVSTAALLLDVSSLEVQRRVEADLDAEFRSNGGANLAVAAIGGLSVGPALNTSRLVDELGGRGRLAGLAAGGFVVALTLSGLEFQMLLPRPVLGGLLLFMGTGVLLESLKVPGKRSWPELALTLAIMVAIIWLGYLTGLVLGIVGACLMFAIRYSRIDVVRRHLTRAEFSAPIERPAEVADLLKAEGGRIHVFWLAGFLFFGSADAVSERIRRALAGAATTKPRWVVLDLAAVTGIDAAAVLAFQKLANWAEQNGVTIVFAGASRELADELRAAGLAGADKPVSASRSEALAWAEDRLIAEAAVGADDASEITAWLSRELGAGPAERIVRSYLRRRDLQAGENVCLRGEPSDTIELITAGSVAVVVPGLDGATVKVRSMTRATVVGEMGFFRELPRAASVVAEGPATVWVMSRASYSQMREAEPQLCAEFLEFVVRTMADRVEAANTEITGLL